jgi:hypothetical protein
VAGDEAMTAPSFLVVPEHVARNPIARAIQRRKVAEAVDRFATRLYMLEAGEECASDLDATARTLGVALAVLEARKLEDATLADGLAVLTNMAQHSCCWQPEYAGTIYAALMQAQDVFSQASAEETRLAWVKVGAA